MIKRYQPQCTGFWEMGSTAESWEKSQPQNKEKKSFLLQYPLFEISSEDLNKHFAIKMIFLITTFKCKYDICERVREGFSYNTFQYKDRHH